MKRLGKRQAEALELIAQGYTNDEIAGLMFISESTVKATIANVVTKLDARNRTHAVSIGYRTGLLCIDEGAEAAAERELLAVQLEALAEELRGMPRACAEAVDKPPAPAPHLASPADRAFRA